MLRIRAECAAISSALYFKCTRLSDDGCFATHTPGRHSLTGRIGRGAAKSFCLLLADERKTEVADTRLQTMVETADGFRIAEIDLKLRGPGEFFGTRQWGIPAFRSQAACLNAAFAGWAASCSNPATV